MSTCFKDVTVNEIGTGLADQLRSWHDMESFGAEKQVDTTTAADARASRGLQEKTYHARCRYQVGMLRADDEISLPNNYFSALAQLKLNNESKELLT